MSRLNQCLLVLFVLIGGKELLSQDLNAALDQDLGDYYNVSGVPGSALAVIQEGKVAYQGSYYSNN